jgi:flagellar basal body-associated protein FliL
MSMRARLKHAWRRDVSPRPISILILTLIVALTIVVAAIVIWSFYNRTTAPGVPSKPLVHLPVGADTP